VNTTDEPNQAVALAYDGEGAPRVVAKGGGDVAARILEVARQHGVPLEHDPALVQLLSRVDLGEQIPRPLFAAVAQVLAFAWSVAGRLPPGRR
jgi:flagellar biosynthesis protein